MSGGSEFEGLSAIVTGAGSGIGLATTGALARRGTRVGALDIQPPDESANVLPVDADVTDQESVDTAVGQAMNAFGGIDLLINNAGIGSVGTVVDNPDEEWHQVYDVNVVGMVRLARATLPHLRRSKKAVIV